MRSTGYDASRGIYFGVFLIALATLMYEILLTRIFSVTMWYHFSFVAISVAMFGMSVGALVVYLRPRWFDGAAFRPRLSRWASGFAASVVASFTAHLYLRPEYGLDPGALASVGLFYLVIAAPFVPSGVVIALALTRFPKHIGRVYGSDLAGAAMGCLLLILLLNLTDGPSAVLFVAAIAALSASCFAGNARREGGVAIGLMAVLLVAGVANHTGGSWLLLRYVKGERESAPLYEEWNSHSRVTVSGDSTAVRYPFGWGMSANYPAERGIRYLYLQIDAGATTVLPRFGGDLAELDYLRYDIVNAAHWIRVDADVAVIGSGGGRDIHSGLVFGQKSITGIEVNQSIIDAVEGPFADWTGHLADDPRVRFVHDEARSYIARSKRDFDIIQISFIDTWAATAAGAYVLTENTLYTVEAWKNFLTHLEDDGVLSVSRWYARSVPAEAYRTVALASRALRELGVDDPRDHILLARNMSRMGRPDLPYGVGTILVSPTPFSDEDIDTIEQLCARLRFDVVLSPRETIDERFSRLAEGEDPEIVSDEIHLAVAPPTDDAPFFFHQLRLRDLFRGGYRERGLDVEDHSFKAVSVLGSLLIAVTILTVLFLIVPLMRRGQRATLKGAGPLLLYFGSIGFGFMLVEISQLQRLTVYLGHPTYGLSVVLFSLLLAAGLGSTTVGRDFGRRWPRAFFALLGLLVLFGLVTPAVIAASDSATTPARIAISIALLMPLGFFLGTAFPQGMRVASRYRAELTPWLWGINGATSVCSSVLAVVLALAAGISATYWAGAVLYLVAMVAYAAAWNRASD